MKKQTGSRDTLFGSEFAITALSGLRAFDVDAYGRLRGIHHRAIVRPGVNEAACGNHSEKDVVTLVQKNHRSEQAAAKYKAMSWKEREELTGLTIAPVEDSYSDSYDKVSWREDRMKRKAKDVLLDQIPPLEGSELAEAVCDHLASCKCGFYSYFLHEDSLDYSRDGGLAGIVANTGYVLSGDKGVRSTKMEVIALAPVRDNEKFEMVDLPKPNYAHWWHRLGHWVEDHTTVMFLGMTLSLLLLIASIVFTFVESYWFAFAVGVFGFGAYAGWLGFFHDSVGRACAGCRVKYSRKGCFDVSIKRDAPEPELYERVKANYPDVKFYRSVTEMLRHHAVDKYTPPPFPSPDNTDGFWDMP